MEKVAEKLQMYSFTLTKSEAKILGGCQSLQQIRTKKILGNLQVKVIKKRFII